MYVEDRCIPSLNPCFHRVALPLPYTSTVSESRAMLVQFLQQLTCLQSLRERRSRVYWYLIQIFNQSSWFLTPFQRYLLAAIIPEPYRVVIWMSSHFHSPSASFQFPLLLTSQYSSTCYLPKSCWYLIFPHLLCPLVLFLFANYYNLMGFGERMQIKH